MTARSPFIPPSAPQTAGPVDALSAVELTGMFSLDGKPRFSLCDTTTGRSVWVGIGETQDGLTVRSYDEKTTSVVVEGRGATRRIVIKEATVKTAAAPRPAPTGLPQTAAPQPGVLAQSRSQTVKAVQPLKPKMAPRDPKVEAQERDARLLVSDLMEISIQERKRYRENQRRAAAGLPRLAPNEPLPDNP